MKLVIQQVCHANPKALKLVLYIYLFHATVVTLLVSQVCQVEAISACIKPK